jgi:hypothetical protein
MARKPLGVQFCHCIKSVAKTVKVRGKKRATRKQKESVAIAICVRSVLGSRGKTLRRFTCRDKVMLRTQKPNN